MDFDTFLEQFRTVMDRSAVHSLAAETRIRELEGWDSLRAVSTIAMIVDEFGVELSGGDFERILTIGDLYARVMAGLADART